MIRQILLDVEEQRVKAELEQIRKEELEKKETQQQNLFQQKDPSSANLSEIKFKHEPDSASITHNLLSKLKSKQFNKCGICQTNESSYKCPKCKVLYCNLDCYKTHSEKCTEEFYKECVMKELKSTKASREAQSSMKKILQGVKDSQEDDEPVFYSQKQQERFNEILNKIENLNLNDLTQQEQHDFESYVKTVKNFDSKLEIREWIPWWRDYEEEDQDGFVKNFSKLIIEEIDNQHSEKEINLLLNNNLNNYVLYDKQSNEEDEDKNENDHIEESKTNEEQMDPISEAFNVLIDELEETEDNNSKFNYKEKYAIVKERYKRIKSLSLISSKSANANSQTLLNENHEEIFKKKYVSPLIKYHIINVLYLFIFYYRLHNGEILDSPPMINFNNESDTKSLMSVDSAIQKANEKLAVLEGFNLVSQYKPVIIQDLIDLFESESTKMNVIEGILRLYDLIHFVECELKDPKRNFKENTRKTAMKIAAEIKKILLFKHKLLFYLSYMKEQDEEFYKQIKEELQVFRAKDV